MTWIIGSIQVTGKKRIITATCCNDNDHKHKISLMTNHNDNDRNHMSFD
jgi:hypothetical protein